MRWVISVVLAGMMFFTGCRTLDTESLVSLPLAIPETYSIEGKTDKQGENWWFFLGSHELNILVKDALNHNLDLKILKTKIDQAKARVEKEEAAVFPFLGFSLGAQKKTAHSQKTDTGNSGQDGNWDGSLNASHTVDVFGEVKALKNVQALGLKAAEQDLEAGSHELTAQIVETWINIITVRSKKAILEDQVKINKTLLALQELRFANGGARALDVSQQREALAEAKSQVPLLEKQEIVLLNHLAFLSGKTASHEISVETQVLPGPLQVPDVGIPSQLLENRADILAARMRLSSSRWAVSAAETQLLPKFKLSAQALFSSGALDRLFQNWVSVLAGSIAGPIFDGGFRHAEVNRARAEAEERLNLYAKTVTKAILEVEDSLISLQKQAAYLVLLEEQLGVAQTTLKNAMHQYQNGQSSYLSYLIAWTGIERMERQLADERASYIKEWIGLHRALGWKPAKPN